MSAPVTSEVQLASMERGRLSAQGRHATGAQAAMARTRQPSLTAALLRTGVSLYTAACETCRVEPPTARNA